MLELGLLIMEGSWQKDTLVEPKMLIQLMSSVPVHLMRTALWKISMVPKDMQPSEVPELPLYDVLGVSEQECRRYLKLARFVQYLECTGRGGSPQDIIEAVEWFPKDAGRWLKVAGGDKGVILWDNLKRKPNTAHEVVVEFGTLVGYTSIRLGAICVEAKSNPSASRRCADVVSVELDACHACVARHAIDLAGLSASVEVWIGQVRDLIPRILEEFGGLSLCYVFMDQKGTAFHDDLRHLEDLGITGVRSRVLADNCLKPGAPFFVWHVSNTNTFDTTIWSVSEFASEEIEDWMIVGEYIRAPSREEREYPDRVHDVLVQLAWETDNMRAGAERGGMHVDDWVAFSQYMRRYFAHLGIEAVPWIGIPEPETGYPADMPLDNKKLAERFDAAILAEASFIDPDE